MKTEATPRGLDFLTIVRIVVRRWYVVLPVLGLTWLAILQIVDRIEPEYGANGSVLLQRVVDRAEGTEPFTVNNYVIAEVLGSDEVRDELEAQGLPIGYEITPQETSGILSVEAFGTSPDGLAETVRQLLERAAEEMRARQDAAGVAVDPDALRILSTPTVAVAEALTIATPESPALIHYVARGSAVVATLSVGGNPYAANSYTTRVLVEGSRDPGLLEDLGVGESGTEFELAADPRDPAPIIAIEVTGQSADEVSALYDGLVESLSDRLAAFQDTAGVATAARLELRDLATPTAATLLSTNLTRPVVAIAGLGLLAAITLALALDPPLLRLRARRSASSAEATASTSVPAPPAVEPSEEESDDMASTSEHSRQRRRRKVRTKAA